MKDLVFVVIIFITIPTTLAKTYYIINVSDVNEAWINKNYAAEKYIEEIRQKDPEATIKVINTFDEFENLINELKTNPNKAEKSVIINTHGENVPFPESYDKDNDDTIEYDEVVDLMKDIREVISNGATWVNPAGYPFYYVHNPNLKDANESTNFNCPYGGPDDGFFRIATVGANTVLNTTVNF
jgi:hypothetical protein